MATAKNYDKIAAARIHRPSQLKRLPKILIYGRNKKGKTKLALSAGVEETLFADPEHGTDYLIRQDPHVWPIEKWEDMDEYYQFLRHGKHNYDWACVDGMTRISNMALRYVMKVAEERDLARQPGMVQQRDYGKAGELMKQMLTNMHNLPMGVIYTAQERQMEGYQGEEDEDAEPAPAAYVPDLPKGVRNAVLSIVDVIGRLYVVKVQSKTGEIRPQRRLWIAPSEQFDTGFRSDFALPDMVKAPTIPKLVALMKEGSS